MKGSLSCRQIVSLEIFDLLTKDLLFNIHKIVYDRIPSKACIMPVTTDIWLKYCGSAGKQRGKWRKQTSTCGGEPVYSTQFNCRHELMADLIANWPSIIVVDNNENNNLMLESAKLFLAYFPELRMFIEGAYEPTCRNNRFAAYRLSG